MKMSETLLRTIIGAVRDTNKNRFMCDPSIVTWTADFADNLEKRLDEKVKA